MRKLSYLLIVFLATACTAKKQETLAHITQRRMEANGKLMVQYRFIAGNRMVADSMEVSDTTIVPHDSVRVSFTAEEPFKSTLLVP